MSASAASVVICLFCLSCVDCEQRRLGGANNLINVVIVTL